MIGPFLVLIGGFLALVSVKGKSFEFLNAMFPSIQQSVNDEEKKIDDAITNWTRDNIWNPLAQTVRGGLLGWLPFGLGQIQGPGGSSSSSGSGSNALVHGYNIPLSGGGSMTVNSTSQGGAIADVIAQGGTPANYG